MAKLENITVGSSVKGIAGNEAVTIVAVQWYGTNVIDITYRNSQNVSGQQLLYREDESRIEVMDKNLSWSFDANGDQLKLASEAYRISLAHLFDPYLAVHTSSVEPLPHQISAVYKEMLPRLPLRYVLADDPGAGKTIMTGLFIKELIAHRTRHSKSTVNIVKIFLDPTRGKSWETLIIISEVPNIETLRIR